MLFAQLQNVRPDFLQQSAILVVVGVSVLVGLGGMVISIINLKRQQARWISPQPLEVKAAEGYVTKEICMSRHDQTLARVAKVEQEVQAVRDEMKCDRESAASEIKAEVGNVHDRVSEVLRAVSRLEGKIEEISKRVP